MNVKIGNKRDTGKSDLLPLMVRERMQHGSVINIFLSSAQQYYSLNNLNRIFVDVDRCHAKSQVATVLPHKNSNTKFKRNIWLSSDWNNVHYPYGAVSQNINSNIGSKPKNGIFLMLGWLN